MSSTWLGSTRFFCSLLSPRNTHHTLHTPCPTLTPVPWLHHCFQGWRQFLGLCLPGVSVVTPAPAQEGDEPPMHTLCLAAPLIPKDTSHGGEGDEASCAKCCDGAQRQIPNPLVQGSLTCHSLSSSRYLSTILSTPSTEVPPPSLSSVGSRYCEGG